MADIDEDIRFCEHVAEQYLSGTESLAPGPVEYKLAEVYRRIAQSLRRLKQVDGSVAHNA